MTMPAGEKNVLYWRRNRIVIVAIVVLIASALIGCGGGGGSSTATSIFSTTTATTTTSSSVTTIASTTYSISGQVASGGAGLSGVTVTLSGAGSASVTTNANGNYTFSGLANGSYTVTPNKTGLTFSPAGSSQTVSNQNNVGVNFSALYPRAYVANSDNTVSVIDTGSNSIVATISPAVNGNYNGISGIAINPTGTRLYVMTYGYNGYSSVINTSSNSIVTEFNSATGLSAAVNPVNSYIYFANYEYLYVSDVNTYNNVLFEILYHYDTPVSMADFFYPGAITVNPAGTYVYQTIEAGNGVCGVFTIEADSPFNVLYDENVKIGIYGLASVPCCGSKPSACGIAVNPAGSYLYVANSSGVSVLNTDTNSITGNIPLAGGATWVAINPSGTLAYATNSANSVSVIDTSTNSVVATVPVGNAPNGIAVDPTGAHVYVTNGSSNSVSVISTSTNSVVATVPVGTGPIGIVIGPNPGGGQ